MGIIKCPHLTGMRIDIDIDIERKRERYNQPITMMSWTGINLISFNENKKLKPHLFFRSFIILNKKI